MKVIKCESLKEIVSEQGNADFVDIVFKQLKNLELVSLKNLKSFCSSNNCGFEFPSLEKLVVSGCTKMENFSEKVKCTSILQKIYVVHEQEKRWSWHGHLKDTIQNMFAEKKFFEGLEKMSLSEHPKLQQAWNDGVDIENNWFYSLKTLKLVNCEIQPPCAIPSHVLPYLNRLKELEVRNCKKVKAVFDMNGTEIIETSFQLKKLTLSRLDELTHVWKKTGQGTLKFQNLQEVFISSCYKLGTLFPAALAKNLKKLEKLEVQNCEKLEEIVGQEEEAVAQETEEIVVQEEAAVAQVTEKFVFPRLTSLVLWNLPRLTHFCPGTITLECPSLNHLSVGNCKLVLFPSVNQWAISNLEELVLDGKQTLDEKEESTMLFEILEKAPNLEDLTILMLSQKPKIAERGMPGHLKVLTLHKVDVLKRIGSEDSSWLNTLCEKLHKLYVSWCPELTTLVHSHSGVSFSYLKELSIWACHKLEYLFTSSTVKMLNSLEKIEVENCAHMIEIVEKEQVETTSEGIKFERLTWILLKDLLRLKHFYSGNETLELPSLIQVDIMNCYRMEIFSQGSVNSRSFRGIQASANSNDDLIFNNDVNDSLKKVFLLRQGHLVIGDSPVLQKIWLKSESVPDWGFRYLISLVVEGCKFVSDAILPSHLLPVLINLEELQVRKCNLVKAIFDHMIYMGTAPEPLSIRLKKLILDQLPCLEHIWNKDPQGSLSLPFLEEVWVDGCKSMKSLFPASVVKDGLQKLDVKNCEGLQEIFAKGEATKEEADKELAILPKISSLRLQNLPSLEHIWNKDPQGSLSLPFLEEVYVDGCKRIKSLFPASVATDGLKELHVKNCEGLEDIFAKDEATKDEVNKELIILPNITSLRLRNLPNLRCIYPGMHILEWPSLKEIDVMLEILLKEFQTFPDSLPKGQDSSPTDEQVFISLEKVTPNLKVLWLTKEEAMKMEQGKLHVDHQRINSLNLQFFHDESEEFPFVFLSKLTLSRIEKLGVVDNAFKEIFPSQRPDIDCTKILSQLKGLELQSLSQLKSIGLEHSWVGPFLGNLETLLVSACNCLTNLTPSTLSFCNLIQLNVKDCGGLKYLFTSSTVKTLPKLEKMRIANCVSIEEIVFTEGEEQDTDNMIIFVQLGELTLDSLPELKSFCSGSSFLHFPTLSEVSITRCQSMKCFCNGAFEEYGKVEMRIDGAWCSGMNINNIIKKQVGEYNRGC
ncbi:uncharacterized protein LOC133291694 [Gastrolobium bilobum]|uniref:uncharacterized protein LOC133291694 n=1 Tax=Gastrolobium bilobum TaxID=150636 RepID=UPI002AB10757|nr:uncharacterized protein LOC133291694 [Gastrolobium bilobum]